ncbi:MAG: hypothetical protein WCX96_03010 [Bacilli bacterium]
MWPEQDVKERIEGAVHRLIKEDKDLFEIDVNERTLCHRLALYLECKFKDYNIDCEYNRNGDRDPKKIFFNNLKKSLNKHIEKEKDNDTVAKTVYPDIIIHKRKIKDNLLAIEVKKDSNNNDRAYDLKKLEGYKREFGYKYTVFLQINVGKEYENIEDYYEIEFINIDKQTS